MISENIFPNILCSYIKRLVMRLGFRKFISEVFVNGKFPKILPSKNFPLYGVCVIVQPQQPIEPPMKGGMAKNLI